MGDLEDMDDDDLAFQLTLEKDNTNTTTKSSNEKGGKTQEVVDDAEPRDVTTTPLLTTPTIPKDDKGAVETRVGSGLGRPTTHAATGSGGKEARSRGFESMNARSLKRKALAQSNAAEPSSFGVLGLSERGQHKAEALSGIRLARPIVGSLQVAERTTCFPYVRMNQIARASVECFNEGWSTIAVVVEKSFPKESAKGNKFLVLKIGDLESASFSLFLFGDAFAEHCHKLDFGCVVLITCAKAKADEKGGSGMSFSVSEPDQLMKVGTARDFAICKGIRRDGQPCSMPVNLRHSEYCKYHAGHALKKLKKAKMNIRPQMGGSNFYAHQAKVLGQHERARIDMMHRQRGKKSVKALSGPQLMNFTKKYTESLPNSRGIGAIQAVAGQARGGGGAGVTATKTPRFNGNGANIPLPLPGSKRVPAGAGGSTRMVDLTMSKNSSAGKSQSGSASFAKALEFVKAMGGLRAPDPNKTSSIGMRKPAKKKATEEDGGGKVKRKEKQWSSRGEDKPDFLVQKEKKRAALQNKFLNSFSQTRKQTQDAKGAKSLYEKEADQQDMNEASRRLKPLIQKDELTEQLANTHKVKVKCYFCKQCNQCHEWKPVECIRKGHSVATTQATKRFWECASCRKRLVTVGVAYPAQSCSKCQGTTFNKVGMGRAPTIHLTKVGDRSQFKVRGEEHAKFLKSVR